MRLRTFVLLALISVAAYSFSAARYPDMLLPGTGPRHSPKYRIVDVPEGPRCLVVYWQIGSGLAVSCDWSETGAKGKAPMTEKWID